MTGYGYGRRDLGGRSARRKRQPINGGTTMTSSQSPQNDPIPTTTEKSAPDPAPTSAHAPRGRPKSAWTSVTIGVLLGIGLVVFIAQNTQRVQLSFLAFDGSVPLAVALLASAVVGAAIVLIVGTIRVTQLRLAERRLRKES